MKRILLQMLTAVLLVALGFQIGRMTCSPEHVRDSASSAADSAPAIDEEALTSWECNGTRIDNGTTAILNYKGENAGADVLRGDSIVIARFSASSCKPCVNALTASLRKFADTHPERHIVLLLKGVALRDLYVMAPQFGPQFTLLSCDSLGTDFDGAETPVVFRLSADGRVRDHFTCRYGDYARTDLYLEAIGSEK